MRYIVLVFLGLVFAGCTIKELPITEYKIDIDIPIKKSISKECKTKSLKISQGFSNTKLKTLNMNYAQGKNKIYTYTQSIWAEAPNEAITSEVLKMLRDKQIFKTVQSSKSRLKSDLILEITIERFMQSFDEDLKNSYADIFLNFTIIDANTNKVVSSKSFKAKEISNTLDAIGGVKALNQALSRVLSDSMDWFEEVCR